MPDLPEGTATLLFTDIDGSTRLLQELGRDRYIRALSDQRRIVREAFTRNGGVEVEMQGDSFHFAFAEAQGAVAAAAEAQKALAEHDWESEPIRVRIGIHTGEPIPHEGLYAGLDVHRAARIMSAGHGGQVLISERTHSLLDGATAVTDLGLHRLKDLTEPEKLYQLGGDRFPPLKSLDATNLPVATSALVGRERELREVDALLAEHRLVTITGPGGTGKTRFGLQVAAELVGSYRDGVFWVPLAALTDPALVLPTIAQTIGARDDLEEHLGDSNVLLLLDNLEHLIAAGPALAKLLASANGLRLLVTSRAPLRISGEREYALEPLPDREAATLFCERARAVGRELVPDETVAGICRRLDGLPLAIELAAARTKLLTPETLLELLDDALPLLTGGARDAPERQQTLRATIEWSHELLAAEARQLFARLSVFAGGFSRSAAEEVCDAQLDTLTALVDLSLLKPVGNDRFLMLATIRDYAREALGRTGESVVIARRHAEFFLRVAEDAEQHLTIGGDQVKWLDRLETDYSNVRAALSWWFGSEDPSRALDLICSLYRFWEIRPRFNEAETWLGRAIEVAGAAPIDLRAQVLFVAGRIARWRSDLRTAQSRLEQALTLFREAGDDRKTVPCLAFLSSVLQTGGEAERARSLSAESIAQAERAGDPAVLGNALHNRGVVLKEQGEFDAAANSFEGGLDIFRALEMTHGIANALVNLGAVELARDRLSRAHERLTEALGVSSELGESGWKTMALEELGHHVFVTGDAERAGSFFIEALTLGREQEDVELMVACLKDLAAVARARCDFQRAAKLAGAGAQLEDALGVPTSETDRRFWARFTPTRDADLSTDWRRMWESGEAMSLDAAVEYALSAADSPDEATKTALEALADD